MRSIQPNGPLIRSLRQRKGYSQEAVEALSREAPSGFEALTARTLRSAEAGRRIDFQKLRAIAHILEVSPESLVLSEEARTPFRGLEPYGLEDRRLMGGRDGFIREGAALLLQRRAALVVGSSGSGKSSLCLAGILPTVLEAEPHLTLIAFRPGADPVQALAAALAQTLADTPDLAGALAAEQAHREALETEDGLARLARLTTQRSGSAGLLVYADQGEELCSRAPAALARRFLTLIRQALEAEDPRLRFLMSVRSDQIGDLLDLDAAFAKHLEGATLFLRRMTRSELMEALSRPLSVAKIPHEVGLLYALAQDAENEPGYLPHIQFVLQDLWRSEAPPEDRLTLARYVEAGGMSGAIARHASSVYAGLSPEERRVARAVLPRLVVSSQTQSRDMAARRPLGEFDEGGRALLEKLASAQARLVHITEEEEAECAHEEIIRQWPELRAWLEEDAAQNHAREKLEHEIRLWREADEKQDYLLLTRGRLHEAAALMERLEPEARPPEAARFLSLSRRTQLLRNRTLMTLGASSLVVALGFILAEPLKERWDAYTLPKRQAALYTEMRDRADQYYEASKVMIDPRTYFPKWTEDNHDVSEIGSHAYIGYRMSIPENDEYSWDLMNKYIETCPDLDYKDFSIIDIKRINISNYMINCRTYIIGSSFRSSILSSVNFSGHFSMRNINFNGSFLNGSTFSGSNISNSSFNCSIIDSVDFSDVENIDDHISESMCIFENGGRRLKLPIGAQIPQHCAWVFEENTERRLELRREALLAFLECAPQERAYAFSDLAFNQILEGNLVRAAGYLHEAQSLAPSPYVDLRLAYVAELSGDQDEAQDLYEAIKDREAPRFGPISNLIESDLRNFQAAGVGMSFLEGSTLQNSP